MLVCAAASVLAETGFIAIVFPECVTHSVGLGNGVWVDRMPIESSSPLILSANNTMPTAISVSFATNEMDWHREQRRHTTGQGSRYPVSVVPHSFSIRFSRKVLHSGCR